MLFFFKKPIQSTNNILVVRTDGIGDFVLTLPVFEAIKNNISSNVSVLCLEMTSPLLKNNPYIDHIFTISKENEPTTQLSFLQKMNFDCLLVLVNDVWIQKHISYFKDIPVRIGPLSKLNMLFHYTHPMLQKRSRSIKNEAEYNLDLLTSIGISITELTRKKRVRPKIYLTKEEKTYFSKKFSFLLHSVSSLKKSVVIHTGMKGSALNWPLNYYQELIQLFLEKDVPVLLTGFGEHESKQNKILLNQYKSKFNSLIYDLSNQFNIRELCIFLEHVGLFIGGSTGPTHIANAVNTPIISIYPPIQVQSKTRWEPFLHTGFIFDPPVVCGEKYKCAKEACPYYDCIEKILPNVVFKKALSFLP